MSFRPLLRAVCSLLLLTATTALGIPYDIDLDVTTEEELIELAENGDLTDEERDNLIELLQEGVDLNNAGQDDLYELPNLTMSDVEALLEYRKLAGRIEDPEQLVAAEVLDAETLRKLKPFVVINPDQRKVDLRGSAKLRAITGAADDQLPSTTVNVRMKGLQGLRAGVSTLSTRYRLGAVSYDPAREALVAEPESYSVRVPKFFAQWNMKDFSILAGTYTVGFGEKLTLSNAGRQRPNGFYPDDVIQYPSASELGRRFCFSDEALSAPSSCLGNTAKPNLYRSRDFKWSDRFRGLAANAKGLRIGTTGASVDVSGFASYQTRSLYQYYLYDRAKCDDPRDSKCSAPPVFLRTNDPTAPTTRLSFYTLPDVYDELFGGAQSLLTLPSGLKLGAVGWGASPQWHPKGIQLDFQESVRVPFGGPYGAVGAYAFYGLGRLGLAGEVTRTFDSSPGNSGGGWGVLQRSVMSGKKRELELTLRYYDKRFNNPYSSPVSGADQFEGQRARNEAGLRVRYLDRAIEDFNVRGTANFWVLPEETRVAGSAGRPNLETTARVKFVRYKQIQPEVFGAYSNRGFAGTPDPDDPDLDPAELEQCVDLDGASLDDGDCAAGRARAGGQLNLIPSRNMIFRIGYQHAWSDDGPRDRRWIQDRRVWVEGMIKPLDVLRVRVKSRLNDEDIWDLVPGDPDARARGETTLWSSLDVTYWMMAKKLGARVRYDSYVDLDTRVLTPASRTNPWHAFRIELEGRY